FHALGKTLDGRALHITFTLRGDGTLIRVISARDMHRKERSVHDQARQAAAQVQDRGAGARVLGDRRSRLHPAS
ncbi:MAG: BrnT family toxin, partial [Betaproteobacteria bacterium]|nr:BrnT family toxin [Betaproteobacteria bacterium]